MDEKQKQRLRELAQPHAGKGEWQREMDALVGVALDRLGELERAQKYLDGLPELADVGDDYTVELAVRLSEVEAEKDRAVKVACLNVEKMVIEEILAKYRDKELFIANPDMDWDYIEFAPEG